MLMMYRQSIYLCQKDLFQSDPSGLLPSILQVIKGLNEEQKKMENLVRLRILSIDVFNFILFLQSNSAISDLKYHSYEPLPQGHIGKTRGFLPFLRGVGKEHLPEIG